MTDTVKQILDRLYPDGYMGRSGKVYTDTSDFMRITGGDVIVLAGEHYLVMQDEMERSFVVEDPKYWVKRCRHLESAERRILKRENAWITGSMTWMWITPPTFQTHLPGILEKFIVSCQAINDLHNSGEKHGDIQRDHLWVEYESDN